MNLRNIRRDKCHSELILGLTENERTLTSNQQTGSTTDEGALSVDHKLFQTAASLMIFSAMYGYYLNKRIKLKLPDSGNSIRYETFQNQPGGDFVFDLLSLAERDSSDILDNDSAEERAVIFEEYSNGGLHELQCLIDENRGSSNYTIIQNIIQEQIGDIDEEMDFTQFA
jgi:dnd system-associated protein 4